MVMFARQNVALSTLIAIFGSAMAQIILSNAPVPLSVAGATEAIKLDVGGFIVGALVIWVAVFFILFRFRGLR